MSESHGANNRSLRSANRALLLRLLATNGPSTRAALAREVGLTRMSITYIVQEMLADGILAENARTAGTSTAPGRSVDLSLREGRITALGIYIARDAVTGTVADIAAGPLVTVRQPLPPDEDAAALSRRLLSLVSELLERDRDLRAERGIRPGLRPSGIGVSSIGPVDVPGGRILEPPNFHGIADVPVRALLERAFDLPVRIDNDMNAAALAELLYGSARGLRDFLYLGLTNGVGAGLVSDGRLFEGGAGYAGEIGHMSIDYQGPVCSCGNRGCLELYASLPVLLARYAGPLPSSPTEAFAALVDLAGRGDPSAGHIFDDLCRSLSVALVSLANLIDPDAVILGHEGALAGELLVGRLERAVNSRMIQRSAKHLPVRVSAFLDQAPVHGASALVFDRIFQGTWAP
jgi:predicted NBD/HSP70 family sugar kinase